MTARHAALVAFGFFIAVSAAFGACRAVLWLGAGDDLATLVTMATFVGAVFLIDRQR